MKTANNSPTKKQLFKWEPFTYICEDFKGNHHVKKGFLPSDVREKCDFTVFKIHGPLVTSFRSWLLYQLINKGKS